MPRNARSMSLAVAVALVLATPAVFAADQDIDKINGSITAESGQGYGDLETVNGSIKLESGSRAADAQTVNGSIRVDDNVQARSLGTVNGSIRAGGKVLLSSGAETVNGSIFFDRGSRIGDGVTTVNGAIGLVQTEVGGDVETVNGDVTIGVDSHVHGHLKVEKPTSSWMPINLNKRKPRIVIGPNAVVDGPLIFEREVTLYVHSSARTGQVTGATAVRYDGTRAPQD
jgi:DUF4097 and DUF4098 domain-containing protein YvlB